MKWILEPTEVQEAILDYVKKRGCTVEPVGGSIKYETYWEGDTCVGVEVVVNNLVPVPVVVATPPPPVALVREEDVVATKTEKNKPASPVDPAVHRKGPPKKNDPFTPVAPPKRIAPAPKVRVLDSVANPSLLTSGIAGIEPSEVVMDIQPSADEMPPEYLDDGVESPTKPQVVVDDPETPRYDPSKRAEDEASLELIQSLLGRSARLAAEPPPRAARGGADDVGMEEGEDG